MPGESHIARQDELAARAADPPGDRRDRHLIKRADSTVEGAQGGARLQPRELLAQSGHSGHVDVSAEEIATGGVEDHYRDFLFIRFHVSDKGDQIAHQIRPDHVQWWAVKGGVKNTVRDTGVYGCQGEHVSLSRLAVRAHSAPRTVDLYRVSGVKRSSPCLTAGTHRGVGGDTRLELHADGGRQRYRKPRPGRRLRCGVPFHRYSGRTRQQKGTTILDGASKELVD
jgi:hypothetical protein